MCPTATAYAATCCPTRGSPPASPKSSVPGWWRWNAGCADTVFKSVPQRVAGTLATLAGQQRRLDVGPKTVQVALTYDQLAALVGTSRETATKVLSEFADRGPVRLGRGRTSCSTSTAWPPKPATSHPGRTSRWGPIRRMTGVYHTDGGLRGELAYAIGKIRGTAHCALCDITHRSLRTKPARTALVADIPVPFDLVHLNERTPQVAAASDGHTPCVLAHTDDDLVRLLGPEDLDRLAGDVTGFATGLRAAAGRAGLHLPTIADPPVMR